MKLNHLNFSFLNLFLKSNHFWSKKMILIGQLIVKSFYKNEEKDIVNYLININNRVLLTFIKNVYQLYYVFKTILFLYIKPNLNFVRIYKNIGSMNNIFINSKLLFNNVLIFNINNKFKNKTIFNLIYFYFVYFLYIITLKFFISDKVVVSKLPNKISKLTLLRSPHIDKKSREQFEIVTHKSSISFLNLFNNDINGIINNKTDNSYIELMSSNKIL